MRYLLVDRRTEPGDYCDMEHEEEKDKEEKPKEEKAAVDEEAGDDEGGGEEEGFRKFMEDLESHELKDEILNGERDMDIEFIREIMNEKKRSKGEEEGREEGIGVGGLGEEYRDNENDGMMGMMGMMGKKKEGKEKEEEEVVVEMKKTRTIESLFLFLRFLFMRYSDNLEIGYNDF